MFPSIGLPKTIYLESVQSYFHKKTNSNISAATATKTSSNKEVEEKQEDSDDDDGGKEESGVTNGIRSDNLWQCFYLLNLRLLLIYTNSFLFYSQSPAVIHMLKVFFSTMKHMMIHEIVCQQNSLKLN